MLKKIVHKQHLRLATKEYEDSDEEESEDESDISDSDETLVRLEIQADQLLEDGQNANIYQNYSTENPYLYM